MDKIFKNDTLMGVVALATLALVGLMYYQNYKKNKETEVVEAPAA